MLQKRLRIEISKRFVALRKAIRLLIVENDAFGLRADSAAGRNRNALTGTRQIATSGFNNVLSSINASKPQTRRQASSVAVVNTRWRFVTDDKKVIEYQKWLQTQVDAGLLEVSKDNLKTPWLEPHIGSSYKKGILRTYTDVHRADIAAAESGFGFIEGGKAQFLEQAFNSPVGQSKLRLLSTRSFSQLKGVTDEMSKEMSRVLSDGIAQGKGAEALARSLTKTVSTLERRRARVIARTEIVHAHSEGQLDAFEAMNIEQVGVMAEWSTAHDDLVCPMCSPMEGVVLTVKEARGAIPRHPNCRCAWIPANVGEEKGGTTKTTFAGPGQGLSKPGTKATGKTVAQVTDKDKVAARLRKSIAAERPKLTGKEAQKASTWAGADIPAAARKAVRVAKTATKTAPAALPAVAAEESMGAITSAKEWREEFIKRVEAQRAGSVAFKEMNALNTELDGIKLELRELTARRTNLWNAQPMNQAAYDAAVAEHEAVSSLYIKKNKTLHTIKKRLKTKDQKTAFSLLQEDDSLKHLASRGKGKADEFLLESEELLSWVPRHKLSSTERAEVGKWGVGTSSREAVGTGAYVDKTRVIHVSVKNTKKTVRTARERRVYRHEFGHHLSHKIDGFLDKTNAFFKKRTVGESLETLPGFADDVIGRKDKFDTLNSYAGRVYSDGSTPEIASVGIEYIFENPLEVAKKDPEWFEVIIGSLKKLEE